ncbi:hypothetical protein MTE01_01000 [Microbacterium testaceum]|uniref:Uncharacterized protein n=1 Tax=Microbacterium testaceum TaxID=2033 RepID=A0A4Y3QGC1_MICTE|nr:hypothetical protein MTE01_01000 [Microbacterium testaceum]
MQQDGGHGASRTSTRVDDERRRPGGDDDAAQAEGAGIHAPSSERRAESDAAEERPDTLEA